MRLDHLLSKEDEVGIVLLFRGQCLLEQGSYAATKFERTSLSGQVTTFTLDSLALQAYQVFTVCWCRCVCGTHPFPFRTRWLRHRRPMVLCWRRHGRVGGCQLKKCIIRMGMQSMSSILIIQLGFNFLNLKSMYLENYILKMIRHQTVRFKFYKHIFFL